MHGDARTVAIPKDQGAGGVAQAGVGDKEWKESVSCARVVGMLEHRGAGSPPGADGLQVSPRCPGCWHCACCPWPGSARAPSAASPCSQPSPTASSHLTTTATPRSSTMVWPSLTWMPTVTLRSWWRGEWCTQCLSDSGNWWPCRARSSLLLREHVAGWGVVHQGGGMGVCMHPLVCVCTHIGC